MAGSVTDSGGTVRDGEVFTISYPAGGLTGKIAAEINGVACSAYTPISDTSAQATAPTTGLNHTDIYILNVNDTSVANIKVRDYFNGGVNGDDLDTHTPDIDIEAGGWLVNGPNTTELDGNGGAKSANPGNVAAIDTGITDQYMRSTYYFGGADNTANFYIRSNATAIISSMICYQLVLAPDNPGNEIRLLRREPAGTANELDAEAYTFDTDLDYIIDFSAVTNGSQVDLEVKVNGVTQISIPDTAANRILTGDHAGFGQGTTDPNNANRWRDFRVDTQAFSDININNIIYAPPTGYSYVVKDDIFPNNSILYRDHGTVTGGSTTTAETIKNYTLNQYVDRVIRNTGRFPAQTSIITSTTAGPDSVVTFSPAMSNSFLLGHNFQIVVNCNENDQIQYKNTATLTNGEYQFDYLIIDTSDDSHGSSETAVISNITGAPDGMGTVTLDTEGVPIFEYQEGMGQGGASSSNSKRKKEIDAEVREASRLALLRRRKKEQLEAQRKAVIDAATTETIDASLKKAFKIDAKLEALHQEILEVEIQAARKRQKRRKRDKLAILLLTQ